MSAFASFLASANRTILQVHGEPVIYRQLGTSDQTISGAFADTVSESLQPGFITTLTIISSDLASAPARGDNVFRGAVAYLVDDIGMADPAGGVVLFLRRIS